MTKLIRGICALLLVVFLGACPSDAPDPTNVPSERVKTPVIAKNPPRNFNNEGIEISFTSATSGAEFYYTLDGSAPSQAAGVKYNGPFSLEAGNENIHDTPNPGSIQVRVIGIKEGLRDSLVSGQMFQIFPAEPVTDDGNNVIAAASETGIGVGGYYNSNQNILVTVTVTDGVITATYQNGYNSTELHSSEYWSGAVNHVNQFLSTMNSWEFDTVTGATLSSRAIKDGLEKAMAKILAD